MIVQKKVMRWFAPYMASSGETRYKGFGSRRAAARFLAKQALYDQVFGPKEELFIQTAIDDGYSIYRRKTPDSKEEREAMFARRFPLENHAPCRDYWGEPVDCNVGCDARGWAVCDMFDELARLTAEFMKEVAK